MSICSKQRPRPGCIDLFRLKSRLYRRFTIASAKDHDDVGRCLSLWLIGTVRAEPETVIPRPGRINCFRITGVHVLRLISRTGKRVWRCPL